MSPEQPLSVPVDRVLAVTQGQRNTVMDENAQLRALVDQLLEEKKALAAEAERLRAGVPVN